MAKIEKKKRLKSYVIKKKNFAYKEIKPKTR